MEMKFVITGLSHEDLVNLFSTATYGNDLIDVVYPEEKQVGQYGYADDDCYEDKIAKALLKGADIKVVDLACDPEDHKEDVEFYGLLVLIGSAKVIVGVISVAVRSIGLYIISTLKPCCKVSVMLMLPHTCRIYLLKKKEICSRLITFCKLPFFGEIIYG